MEIILGNLLIAVGQILGIVLTTLIFILIGRVIVSWVNADPYNFIVRFLLLSTEPMLRVVRRVCPKVPGPLDFSPLILLLIIYFLNYFLVATLLDLGVKLKAGSG